MKDEMIIVNVSTGIYKCLGIGLLLSDILFMVAGFIISTLWLTNMHIILGQVLLVLLVIVCAFICAISIRFIRRGLIDRDKCRVHRVLLEDFDIKELDNKYRICSSDDTYVYFVNKRDYKIYLDSILSEEIYTIFK